MKMALGARTSRPHSVRSTLVFLLQPATRFALRAQCGRDVCVPSDEKKLSYDSKENFGLELKSTE
jgi:hypothetical protein